MKVYPNPANAIAYISVPSEMKNGGNLTVTNKSGDTIFQQSFTESNTQLLPLDLSEQPNGMYKVTLGNEEQEVSYDFLNLNQVNCPVML